LIDFIYFIIKIKIGEMETKAPWSVEIEFNLATEIQMRVQPDQGLRNSQESP
jgi:hypothetical protein